jgi:hypothetical protein
MSLDFFGLFILIAGYVLGLGAVTVIDLHGFLGRKSEYWTEATTRTHKVTKPLIWIGIVFVLLGSAIFYRGGDFDEVYMTLVFLYLMLVLNGLFLSFSVSPFLNKREKEGDSKKILPASWQNKIIVSFIFSFVGWWGSLFLVLYSVVKLF